MSVAAYVLTGGNSTRMGRDKALLPCVDGPLVQRVARIAASVAGPVHLVGAPERYAHLDWPCLPERYPGCGPMSGIEAALRHCSGWSLILACDMPNLDLDWLRQLLETALLGNSPAVVAAHPGGELEPLCAAYHARLQPLFAESLQEGRYSVQKLLNTINFTRYAIGDEEHVANLNTPRDWVRWSK